MLWIQLAVVLLFIFLGARISGIGLGLMGGLGLTVLVFLFRLQPSSPPIDVIMIILAVVSATAAMQAAGGLDYLVQLAERLLRKNPRHITFVAPAVSWVFTFFAGTAHVSYSVLAVIAELARETKIRPERPLSVSVIAAQFAIIGGPISAAMAAFLTITADKGMTLFKLMAITAPSTFLGCMVAALVMNFMGKELEQDPEYLRRLEKGLLSTAPIARAENAPVDSKARLSVLIFLAAAVMVTVMGAVPSLRPVWMVSGKPVQLTTVEAIQLVMLSGGGLILALCKADVVKAVKGSVFQAGTTAAVGIFGISWMTDTWSKANATVLQAGMKGLVTQAPWLFALGVFALAILLYSQAATTRAIMPVGLALGLPVPYLAAMLPATCGGFFFPNYGNLIAAINFDTTGTTKIGKYVLNHSFMLPGVVALVSAVFFGFVMQALVW